MASVTFKDPSKKTLKQSNMKKWFVDDHFLDDLYITCLVFCVCSKFLAWRKQPPRPSSQKPTHRLQNEPSCQLNAYSPGALWIVWRPSQCHGPLALPGAMFLFRRCGTTTTLPAPVSRAWLAICLWQMSWGILFGETWLYWSFLTHKKNPTPMKFETQTPFHQSPDSGEVCELLIPFPYLKEYSSSGYCQLPRFWPIDIADSSRYISDGRLESSLSGQVPGKKQFIETEVNRSIWLMPTSEKEDFSFIRIRMLLPDFFFWPHITYM